MRGPLVLLCLLAGCSETAMIQASFPDRTLYRIESAELGETMGYACLPEADAAATEARAQAAHAEFVAAVLAFSERQMAGLPERIRKGEETLPAAIRMKGEGEAWAAETVASIEERHHCLALSRL